MNSDQKLLNLNEVAAQLGVSRAWARDHCTRRDPRIPVIRLGEKRALLRVRQTDLAQFIIEHLISPEEGGCIVSTFRRTRMRLRHQDGWVEERGTKSKRWYGHYYRYLTTPEGKEIRRHIGVMLGEKSEMRKFEAVDKLRKIITSAAQAQPKPSELTLDWFVTERFLPMRSAKWAPSTKETNLYHLNRLIMPKLGTQAICEIEEFHCQVFLNKLAEADFSFTIIDHCRTMLKAVFEEALDADLIGKNPARKLYNPETKEPEEFVLPKTQPVSFSNRFPFVIGSWLRLPHSAPCAPVKYSV
jgi:hypothetical protein